MKKRNNFSKYIESGAVGRHELSKILAARVNMIARCYSPSYVNWRRYQGRQIRVCADWLVNSKPFVDWSIGNGYALGLSLDRIDNDGHYEPTNCRWADSFDQMNNTCYNVCVTHNDETKTLAEWIRALGLSEKEKGRVRSRWVQSNERSFEALFYPGSLRTYRCSKRHNECLVCGATSTYHWYASGKLCGSCYCRRRNRRLKVTR